MDASNPTSPASRAAHSLELYSRVHQRWISEVPILAIGLALFALCVGLLLSKGVPLSVGGVWANLKLFGVFVVLLLAVDAGIQLIRCKPDSPISHLKTRYSSPTAREIAASDRLDLDHLCAEMRELMEQADAQAATLEAATTALFSRILIAPLPSSVVSAPDSCWSLSASVVGWPARLTR